MIPLVSILLLLSCSFAFSSGSLVFEETLVEVIASPNQKFVDAKFPFSVEGDQPAVVKKFEAPCSCLEAKMGEEDRKVWQPGEKGHVIGTFEVGTFRGTVKKQIHITLANGKSHKLTVAMTTPQLVTVEPKTLKWQAGEEAIEKTLKITLDPQYPVKIKSVTNSNPKQFDQHLEVLVEGESYHLRVTPKSTASRALGVVRIATDSAEKRHQNYQAFLVVEKESFRPKRKK